MADRALLEGWRDRTVDGLFEVLDRKADRLTLLNLADELSYEVYSTAGAAAIRAVARGSYLLTRILPVAEVWTLSGAQRPYAKRDRRIVATILAAYLEHDPTGPMRNPVKRARALEVYRTYHEVFLGLFGTHWVAGTGPEAAENLRRFVDSDSACRAASGRERRPATSKASNDSSAA